MQHADAGDVDPHDLGWQNVSHLQTHDSTSGCRWSALHLVGLLFLGGSYPESWLCLRTLAGVNHQSINDCRQTEPEAGAGPLEGVVWHGSGAAATRQECAGKVKHGMHKLGWCWQGR